MLNLNFPTTGITTGTQYTGDNGVTYIYDGVKWVGHSVAQPAGTNSITNAGHTVQVDGSGNLVTPNYVFPATSGIANQVLVWPNSGNTLVWSNQSGSGGGSSGPVNQLTSGTAVLSLDLNSTLKTVSPNLQVQIGESYAPYWVAEYGGLGSSAVVANDYAYGTGAIYDSKGNLYILGSAASQINGSTFNDSLLLKYDPAGNLLWHKTWRDPINGGNCGATNVAVAIDANDRIYWVANDWTSGGMWTGYMDTDGNLGLGGQAQQVLGFSSLYPTDLACDTSGNYYISGAITATGSPFGGGQYGQPIVVKINGDSGDVVWTSDLTPVASDSSTSTGLYRAVTVNAATGDIWAVGDYVDISTTWAMLTKWNSAGVHQWTKKLVTYSGDKGEAVVFNNGHVYTVVNDGTEVKVVVSKFTTNGTLVWASNLAQGGSDPQGFDLSFDSDNNVYLTGTLQGQIWLTKLDPATGAMLYSRNLVTQSGEIIFDGSGDPLVGHRVGDIYQDKIAITAMTQSDLTQAGGFNSRIILAQLPIDGSITGVFNNVEIGDITSTIAGSCTTGTYSVTSLTWITGTIGTSIGTLSQLSASAVTTVGQMSGRIISISTGTRSTAWNFGQDGGLAFPDGTVQYSAAAGAETRWTATPAVSGCPIYTELTPDHFYAYTQQSHLSLENAGDWWLGSSFNGTYVGSLNSTDTTVVAVNGKVVVGAGSRELVFRGDGSLTLPDTNKITAAVTPQVGYIAVGVENPEQGVGTDTFGFVNYIWSNASTVFQSIFHLGLNGWYFYPVGHPEQSVVVGTTGQLGSASIGFNTTLPQGPYVAYSPDYRPAVGHPIVVETNANTWTFMVDGSLKLTGSNPESIYGGPGIIDFTPDSSLRIGTPTLTGSGFRDHNIRHAIAIGNGAQDWNVNTGSYSIVIGSGDDTGYGAKDKSVVIGSGAGFNDGGAVGTASIAIGYRANYDHGADHTITLNATGNDLSVDHSGFFVKPIRQDGASRAKAVFYNTATGELTYTTSTVYQLTSGTAVLSVASDSSVTLPNGAKLDGGVSYKFATDNSVTQYIDLRDASGRGFYTDGSGYTLRSSSSYSWIFGPDGSLRAPALPVNGASFDIVYTQPTLMLGVNSSDSTIADTPSDETNRGNRTILIQGQRGYGSFSTNGPGGKGTSVRIQGGLGGESGTTNGGGEGGTINVYGGDGNGGNGGGWVNIGGGTAAYNDIGSTPYGGQVNITGGSALGAYSGTGIGGDIILQGGRGNFANGRVSIQTFDSLLSTWNNWNFNQDGTLNIQGDIQDSNGSVIRIATTSTAPTRVNGQLWFNTDEGRTYIKYNGQWVDASPTEVPPVSTYLGDITVIGNTLYINTSTLTIDDSGTLLVNGAQVTGTGGGGGGGFITSGTLFGPQIVGFVPPDSALIFSSTASNSNLAELGFVAPGGFGSNNDFISVLGAANLGGSTASSVMIFSAAASGNQSQWKFGGDGVLTLSTASTILGTGSDPNVYIETVTSSTTSIWTFGTNGVLTLPASTPVIKGAGSGTDVTLVATTGSNTSTWVFGANGTTHFPQYTFPAVDGAAYQMLQTDGSGNLTWVDNAHNYISNGTSGVTIPGENGNVIMSVEGNTIAEFTPTGVNITGNLNITNSATYIVSTNTVYTDSLIEIHAPPGGVASTWTSNDLNDIGFRFHYYNGADKNAGLYMDNGTWRLKWAVDGVESGGQFVHSGLGDIEARTFYGNLNATTATFSGGLTIDNGGIAGLDQNRVNINSSGANGGTTLYWLSTFTNTSSIQTVSVDLGQQGGGLPGVRIQAYDERYLNPNDYGGWTFDYYGNLSLPDGSTLGNNKWISVSQSMAIKLDDTYVQITPVDQYSNSTTPWTFSSTGTLTFPNDTVQTTAYLGTATTGRVGGVKIGSGISITADGTISAAAISTSSFLVNNFTAVGTTTVGVFKATQVAETFTSLTPANASTATLNCSGGNVFNITMGTLGQNWTPWLTNLNVTSGTVATVSIIVNQTGTAYIPTSVVIPGATNTSFTWQGGSTPTGSPNKKDVIAYNIYSTATNQYVVLAQLISF
jgi:hypothetical protein